MFLEFEAECPFMVDALYLKAPDELIYQPPSTLHSPTEEDKLTGDLPAYAALL